MNYGLSFYPAVPEEHRIYLCPAVGFSHFPPGIDERIASWQFTLPGGIKSGSCGEFTTPAWWDKGLRNPVFSWNPVSLMKLHGISDAWTPIPPSKDQVPSVCMCFHPLSPIGLIRTSQGLPSFLRESVGLNYAK